MKYVLYIDYRCEYKPMTCEYRVMRAETMKDAVIEADRIHDRSIMYLIRIMEKSGRVENVGSGVKARTYAAVLEKRSTKWAKVESEHKVKRYLTKYGDWFEIQ